MEEIKKIEQEKRNLFNYAHIGGKDGFAEKLRYLASIAEPEKWTLDGFENHILYHYILDTFDRCQAQNKIIVSDDGQYSVFNTGLLTINGQDIYGYFTKNKNQGAQEWYFAAFLQANDRSIMDKFLEEIPLASYYDDYNELYFDPSLEIVANTDHIIDDNWERVQSIIKEDLGKPLVRILINGALEESKKRIARNMRLVVPQFYNNSIMYLLPLTIPFTDDRSVTFALAVEKVKNKYRANTIFTLDMAYGKARLLMKPESNWLLKE